ncbi:DUF2141 domain-containing protein [Flammeovirga sp. SJP92]|uniref:DUF2141 domain-containing protein n=1 Tax=Flammeovirga sp. SJP92 TaxID=1775430 RepID=UPI0007898871|nr:DUF2141 domain-containing protein [Flammeovirga sp. SJP92]KXX72644.1 hypothetical protein AVL50_06480 [Flammeovirga sp. SJP92]
MKTVVLLSTFFLSFYLNVTGEKNTVEVTITSIASDEGNIIIGVYNKEDAFPKYEEVYRGKVIPAQKGKVHCSIPNLPNDKYAIAVWHDKNNNVELDKNWVGTPKEEYGFSNNPDSRFGPPTFDEASFDFDQNNSIALTIKLQ